LSFKDLPDDACEAVILPKDLERACKVGQEIRYDTLLGIATMGNDVCLGLGTDAVSARMVEGPFPNISQVIPKKRPLFTFRVDPRILAETLLAMADLLPEEARSVQFFYYREDLPLGFCARNIDNGIMIDALVASHHPYACRREASQQNSRRRGARQRANREPRILPGLLRLTGLCLRIRDHQQIQLLRDGVSDDNASSGSKFFGHFARDQLSRDTALALSRKTNPLVEQRLAILRSAAERRADWRLIELAGSSRHQLVEVRPGDAEQ